MRRVFQTVCLAILCPAAAGAQDATGLDRAFEGFWNAGSAKGAEKAAAGIVASGASFARVLERLAQGRT